MIWLPGALSSGASSGLGMIKHSMVRCFSRKRAENVVKINPKVPFPQAFAISESLYSIIKQHGPLTVGNTWNLAKEANIDGLKSKTHMKIMLKWMRGKKLLKLFCSHVGSSKKFLHCTLPEEPQPVESKVPQELNLQTEKPSLKTKKQHRKEEVLESSLYMANN